MADSKPGKVIRVDEVTWDFISSNRRKKEKTVAAIRRLLGVDGVKDKKEKAKTLFVLPSLIDRSMSEARGRAIMIAVKTGKKDQVESPIKVKEVR